MDILKQMSIKNFRDLILKQKYFILIILIGAYLTFQGLDNNYFWDDEANTAIIAKNFLNTGKLTGWDGRNLYGYRNGLELDQNLNDIYMPPLQFFVTALSFAIFGVSTLAARLPFAFIGFCSTFILLLILRELKLNRKIMFVALMLYILSPSFLLYIRQARYFALVMFLSLCVYYFYLKFFNSLEKKYLIGLIVTMILLFYAHFLATAFIAALFAVHFLFHFKKSEVKYLIAIFTSFCLFTIPYFLYFRLFNKATTVYNGSDSWLMSKATLLLWHIRDLNNFNWLPWIVAVGLVYLVYITKRSPKYLGIYTLIKEWITLVLLFVLFMVLISPQPVSITFVANMRYIVLTLPFFAALTAILLSFIEARSKALFILIIPLLVFTNLLSINPLEPTIDYNLIKYMKEIHNDYTTSYEAVDQFLKENAQQDDCVFVSPSYMNYPLMFYSGHKVIFCGILDKDTHLEKDTVIALNPSFFIEKAVPDWIIFFGWRKNSQEFVDYLSKDGNSYEAYKTLHVYWQDQTRAEIPFHSFGQVEDFNASFEGIIIFKRVD